MKEIKALEALYKVKIKKDRKTALYDIFTAKGAWWGRYNKEDLKWELSTNGRYIAKCREGGC